MRNLHSKSLPLGFIRVSYVFIPSAGAAISEAWAESTSERGDTSAVTAAT